MEVYSCNHEQRSGCSVGVNSIQVQIESRAIIDLDGSCKNFCVFRVCDVGDLCNIGCLCSFFLSGAFTPARPIQGDVWYYVVAVRNLSLFLSAN